MNTRMRTRLATYPLGCPGKDPAVGVDWARTQAERLLLPLGARWAHTLSVADQAERLRPAFGETEADQLVAAAYLHDVGYASELVTTGFHPLDGAVWLSGQVEPEVVALVAHHSCAWLEADVRGFGAALDEMPQPKLHVLDALTYCDMTSGPDGRRVDIEQRLAEVAHRYGLGHIVTESIAIAGDYLRDAVARAQARASEWLTEPAS